MFGQAGLKTELHVAEFTDDQGVFCNVWADDPEKGATYGDLKEAAWVIAAEAAKTGEAYNVEVHGDDNEMARFRKALAEAVQYYARLERDARAPRDKLTGRPLFVPTRPIHFADVMRDMRGL